MNRYLVQASYTKEAVAALVKQPEDRSEVVRPLVEQLGGKLLDFYFCLGDYDVAVIVEFPNETAALAFDMAAVMPGHLSNIKTTPLLAAGQTIMAMKEASVVSLRAPGL